MKILILIRSDFQGKFHILHLQLAGKEELKCMTHAWVTSSIFKVKTLVNMYSLQQMKDLYTIVNIWTMKDKSTAKELLADRSK